MIKLFLILRSFIWAYDYEIVVSTIEGKISDIATQKIGIVYFYSIDNNESDGKVIADNIYMKLSEKKKYKILDPIFLNKKISVEKLSEMSISDAKNISNSLGIKYIMMGTTFRNEDSLEVNLRIIDLSTLDTHSVFKFVIDDWVKVDNKKSIKNAIDKYKNIRPKENCKDIELVYIAENNKPSDASEYSCAYFPCGLIDCSNFKNVKKGIYKIFFNDNMKTVFTISDNYEIINKYSSSK